MSNTTENSIWAQQVRAASAQDTLGHAIILSGSGDLTEATLYIAAAYLCTETSRPCLHCSSCRKVARQTHPDVTIVRDPEHKYISVDVIRQVRSDTYIRPNEGARRVFIFPDCTLLTEQDQNVLLKTLEEGPAFAAFLFCAETASSLLPTIRSRCTQFHVTGEEAVLQEDPAVQELCLAIARRRLLSVAQIITAWENKKPKREQLQAALQCARELTAQALLAQYGKPGSLSESAAALSGDLSTAQLRQLSAIWDRAYGDCEFNVGVGLILGAVLSDIEEVIR